MSKLIIFYKNRCNNQDGFTLIELLIGMMIGMLGLTMLGITIYTIQRTYNISTAITSAASTSINELSTTISNVGNAVPLAYCADATPSDYTSPNMSLAHCQHIATLNDAVYSATSGGFCYYAYAIQTQLGVGAPNEYCIAVNNNNLYINQYNVEPGESYISCVIISGGASPPYTYSVNSSCWPVQPTIQTLIGGISANLPLSAPTFSYCSTTGYEIPPPVASNLLEYIVIVQVHTEINQGVFNGPEAYTINDWGIINGTNYQNSQWWLTGGNTDINGVQATESGTPCSL